VLHPRTSRRHGASADAHRASASGGRRATAMLVSASLAIGHRPRSAAAAIGVKRQPAAQPTIDRRSLRRPAFPRRRHAPCKPRIWSPRRRCPSITGRPNGYLVVGHHAGGRLIPQRQLRELLADTEARHLGHGAMGAVALTASADRNVGSLVQSRSSRRIPRSHRSKVSVR
jgi:hypothetical protein